MTKRPFLIAATIPAVTAGSLLVIGQSRGTETNGQYSAA